MYHEEKCSSEEFQMMSSVYFEQNLGPINMCSFAHNYMSTQFSFP
jgi:hypothetical protein